MSDPDEIQQIAENQWRMWALPDERWGFTDPGHRRFALAHAQPGQQPVPVLVTADPDGPHYAWMATGETVPVMIQPHPSALRICFPYGTAAEEAAGRGRVIRLNITACP